MISPLISYGQWIQKSSLPSEARHHPVTMSHNNIGYLLTGATDNGYVNDFYSYEPTTDSWSQLTDFPGETRAYAMGGANSSHLFIGFGVDDTESYFNDLWMYDVANSNWIQ